MLSVGQHGEQLQGAMAIGKPVKDRLLVEARHRCTICAEKCFEIHHIQGQAEGGTDEPDNLIVLCPNCHQHRYHRSGDFTHEQLRRYKVKLEEQNEIERRVLLNLEEIRNGLSSVPIEESEKLLRRELDEAAALVSPDRSPTVHAAVSDTARFLAERELLRGGARRAIEVKWELERSRQRAQYQRVAVARVDESAWRKAPDFPAAYTFVLVLDRVPHGDWVQVFDHHYHQALYNMKRRTTIDRDRIIMIVADQDNLQVHADFAKRLVQETNHFIEGELFRRIDMEIERRKREELAQFDAIQSLKRRTREITL
jgi:hypothetical protein